jgi:hypothetical protein
LACPAVSRTYLRAAVTMGSCRGTGAGPATTRLAPLPRLMPGIRQLRGSTDRTTGAGVRLLALATPDQRLPLGQHLPVTPPLVATRADPGALAKMSEKLSSQVSILSAASVRPEALLTSGVGTAL